MRSLLWPDDSADEHAKEVAAFFNTKSFHWSAALPAVANFVAVRPSGGLCGFLEASIRPFADGCKTQPVGYVEGWFVDADTRQQGIGRRLLTAAEQWAVTQGCKEMASDAQVQNKISLEAHKALGFEEACRAVHFRKQLTKEDGAIAERICHSRRWTLTRLNDTFAVCRLSGDASIPTWAAAAGFFSITRTADELSVVCRQDVVPEDIRCERGWRCMRVEGTIPLSFVGVLASLTTPLTEAGISVFAISTFDTDYLLVKEKDLSPTVEALHRQGHSVG
jgi:GNAT superfamily N-acetyltransferase